MKTKEEKNDLIVRKSNEFIQNFRFDLSKAELRIVNYIIANITSPLYSEEFNTMTFKISDFYKAMDIENPDGKTYEYVKEVIKGLRNKTSDYVNVGEYETIVSWIEKPKFYKKKGIVELKLDDDLKPYLLKLNGHMIARMNYYYKMNSQYSMRIYELLKSYDGFPKAKFDVEDLKIRVGATKKSYEHYGMFKLKILDVAVKEINEITDLIVRYEESKKKGKKVLELEFFIKKKEDIVSQKEVIDAKFNEVKEEKKTVKNKKTTNNESKKIKRQISFDEGKNKFSYEESLVFDSCKEILKEYDFTEEQLLNIYNKVKNTIPHHFTSDGSPAHLYVEHNLQERVDAFEEYKLSHPLDNFMAAFMSFVSKDTHPNYKNDRNIDLEDPLIKNLFNVPEN